MTVFSAAGIGYVKQINCLGSSRPILHPGDGSKLCKLFGHRSEPFGMARDIEGNMYLLRICTRCAFARLGMRYPKPKPRLKGGGKSG